MSNKKEELLFPFWILPKTINNKKIYQTIIEDDDDDDDVKMDLIDNE